MKKPILPFVLLVSGLGLGFLKAGNKPPEPAPAPVVDKTAENRKKDSTAYQNLVNNSNTHNYQESVNEVVFANGMKVKLLGITRLPLPRGVDVTIPDPVSQRFNYELAELTFEATNTNSYEVKIDASEAVFVTVKLFSPDNAWKSYTSQYSISMGSIYLKTEPAYPEKSKSIYNESFAFFNQSYKPGQTKVCKGIIIPIAKNAKNIDRMMITTKEFGQNITYACPVKL